MKYFADDTNNTLKKEWKLLKHQLTRLENQNLTLRQLVLFKKNQSFQKATSITGTLNLLPYAAICRECDIKWTTTRCGWCDSSFYCSHSCQQKHWNEHEKECELWCNQQQEQREQSETKTKNTLSTTHQLQHKRRCLAKERRLKLKNLLKDPKELKLEVFNEKVATLINLTNCVPELAKKALKKKKGDVNQAAEALLSNTIKITDLDDLDDSTDSDDSDDSDEDEKKENITELKTLTTTTQNPLWRHATPSGGQVVSPNRLHVLRKGTATVMNNIHTDDIRPTTYLDNATNVTNATNATTTISVPELVTDGNTGVAEMESGTMTSPGSFSDSGVFVSQTNGISLSSIEYHNSTTNTNTTTTINTTTTTANNNNNNNNSSSSGSRSSSSSNTTDTCTDKDYIENGVSDNNGTKEDTVPFPLPNSILDTPDHRTKWNEMCSITVPSDSLSVQRCWKILKKSWNIEKSINAYFSQTPDSDSDDSSNNDGMPALVDAVSEGDSID